VVEMPTESEPVRVVCSQLAPDIEQAHNCLLYQRGLFAMNPKSALYQLHWQNRSNIQETEFVGQFEAATVEEARDRLNDLIERRRNECPEGWGPLVCNQDSGYFVLAAGAAAGASEHTHSGES
jgi:hypothetical protein